MPAHVLERQSTAKLLRDMMVYNGGGGENNVIDKNDAQRAASSLGADPYFERFPADAYVEAYYIDDEADYEMHQKIYEDPHVLRLVEKQDDVQHVPFNVHRGHGNGTAVLKDAGAHPVLTALRHLDATEDFFNPVCFRYRFPNVSAFPTVSVIVPMQNGKEPPQQERSCSRGTRSFVVDSQSSDL